MSRLTAAEKRDAVAAAQRAKDWEEELVRDRVKWAQEERERDGGPLLSAALGALLAGLEDAGPFHCGACINSHTGNTGNTNCRHADEVNARMGRARTLLSALARGAP